LTLTQVWKSDVKGGYWKKYPSVAPAFMNPVLVKTIALKSYNARLSQFLTGQYKLFNKLDKAKTATRINKNFSEVENLLKLKIP
jgi:hypothetical protein